VSLPGGNDDEDFYSNFEPSTAVLRWIETEIQHIHSIVCGLIPNSAVSLTSRQPHQIAQRMTNANLKPRQGPFPKGALRRAAIHYPSQEGRNES